MKVALINHSDTRGGASVVSLRLVEALNRAGVEATMVVAHREGSSPFVVEGSQWRRRLSFAAEHLDILVHNGLNRSTLFKVSTCRFGMGLDRVEAVRRADIIVLAWINQGTLSFDEIRRLSALGKPIVWIMHDRWNGTGVCHHVPYGCERLGEGCGRCPLLGARHDRDLSRRVFDDKVSLYADVPITFVAVSSWLAEVCAASGPLVGHRVMVIPNAFPAERYPYSPTLSRHQLGLPEGRRLVFFGAARLDDPIKNLPLAIEALNTLGRDDVTAVLFGDIRDGSLLENLKISHVHTGPVTDPERLAAMLAHGDVILSTSRFETLPTTIIEGMAAGCVPVATNRGGQRDIIDGAPAGFLVDDHNPTSVARAINSALDATPSATPPTANLTPGVPPGHALRHAMHDHIVTRFDSTTIAHRFIALFKTL